MTEHLLDIQGLNKSFGGVLAVDNVSLSVKQGELHALIGPNGAGKTSLISLISGIFPSDSGKILFNGKDITRFSPPARALAGLGRSFQITSIFKEFTCQENVAMGVQARAGHSFNFWHPILKERKIQDQALQILCAMDMEELKNTIASQLAHGEQRQLELAIALATEPTLLVLDEPLAGMGRSDSAHMVKFLETLKSRCTILLVEHDMDAVFALADRVSVMVYGRVIACDVPDAVRKLEIVQSAYFGVD